MRAYHSTELSLARRHCPYALDLREQDVPYDRSGFQVGIAAHACLEAVAQRTNEEQTELAEDYVRSVTLQAAANLVANGRMYDGEQEPPMSPDAAMAGRELADNYLLAVESIQPGGMVEVGLGLDESGKPCDYWSGRARIRTILDLVRISRESDEESSRTVLVVRDYKTAWSADEDELLTIQRKVQAIAAFRYFGPVGVLRLEVVNLRLQKVYSEDHYAEDGLVGKLSEWWSEVAASVAALDAQKKIGHRPAMPGAGCVGCPYLQRCEYAQDYIERRGMHRTLQQKATAYCVAVAMADELKEQLRLETDEEPAAVHGGIVGTVVKERRCLVEGAYADLWKEWEDRDGDVHGFLKACELGSGQAIKVAKALYFDKGDRDEREALISRVCTTENVSEFGIHPSPREG